MESDQADNKKRQPVSYRLSEDTKARISHITQGYDSPETAFAAMAALAELNEQTRTMPERAGMIKDFESLTARLGEMFNESLRSIKDTELRVRQEYGQKIELAAEREADLREKAKTAETSANEARQEKADMARQLAEAEDGLAEARREASKSEQIATETRLALKDKANLLALAEQKAAEYEQDSKALKQAIKERDAALLEKEDYTARAVNAEDQNSAFLESIEEHVRIRSEIEAEMKTAQANAAEYKRRLEQSKTDARGAALKHREELDDLKAESSKAVYEAKNEAQDRLADLYDKLADIQAKLADASDRTAKAEAAKNNAEFDLSESLKTANDLREKLADLKGEFHKKQDQLTAYMTKDQKPNQKKN